MPYLVRKQIDGSIADRWELTDKELIAGRGEKAEIRAHDPEMSRQHFKITSSTIQDLGHRRIALQPRHPRELVSPGEDAAEVAQCDVGGCVRVGTGGRVRQDTVELATKLLLLQEVRPDDQAAMCGQSLIGEADSNGRRTTRLRPL